jgi:hypothetical protein
MDRREFLKATFTASAATAVLGPTGKVVLPHDDRVVTVESDGRFTVEGPAGTEELPPVNGVTELDAIAQHLIRRIAERLHAADWPTALAERESANSVDGHRLGYIVMAYHPALEGFDGPQPVTMAHQVSALWETPRRMTGGRREFYNVVDDRLKNGPEIEVTPVALDRLDPIVDALTQQILRNEVNVFSPGLYMPRMSGSCEGAVGYASRTYGLALRLVRCCGPDHEVDDAGRSARRDVPVRIRQPRLKAHYRSNGMAKTAPPEAHKMIGGGLQVSATGEQNRGGKKHVRSIRTSRAKGGGHIVRHEYESGPDMGYHPDAEHVFGSDEGVKHVKHYIRHAGIRGVSVSGAEGKEPAGADDAGEKSDDTDD